MIPTSTEQVTHIPAPWQLHGDGYILLYHFPRNFVLESGFLPPELADSYVGGPGAVMLVDYQHSDAGPYRELLFTPGQFKVKGRRFYSITKIYVSSWESVVNGQRNWGIPKEFADFEVFQPEPNTEHVRVIHQEQVFADFSFKTRTLGLPINTAIVPSSLRTILEPWNGKTYLTAPNGRGRIQAADLQQAHCDQAFFPAVGQFRPLMCVRASGFDLQFPLAQITEALYEN